MRRRAAVVSVVAALCSTFLFLTTEAQAGGPTSVLLTNSNAERAAGVYYTDQQYIDLENLLHGDNTTKGTAASVPSGGGTYRTVTWLIHDVSVWRTDQLVLGIEGAPWIYTQLPHANGAGVTGEKWRSLKDGDAIVNLLSAIGVVGDEQVTSSVDSVTALGTTAAEPGNNSAAPPWRWAVPGLVLGLLAGVLIARWRSREARSLSEPRQVTVG